MLCDHVRWSGARHNPAERFAGPSNWSGTKFEIRLREQECSHTNVGPIDVVFVERPIGNVHLDLDYTCIDGVRTVRFARPIRVVSAAQFNRGWIEKREGRFVDCWILGSRAAERQCHCKSDTVPARENSARERQLRAPRTSNVIDFQLFLRRKEALLARRVPHFCGS
jgi:hypothetical protein